jgi:membrane protein implicated in regulation of membrane protease activity
MADNAEGGIGPRGGWAMPWWGWVVVGAVLLGAEIVVPTDFYLVFLGLSAIAVGFLGVVGLEGPPWVQWALFGLFSVVSLVFFRRHVRARFTQSGSDPRVDDTLVGEVATVQETLAPGSTGRAELRGTTWTVRNAEPTPLPAGSRARVERVEGLLLHLRAEEPR